MTDKDISAVFKDSGNIINQIAHILNGRIYISVLINLILLIGVVFLGYVNINSNAVLINSLDGKVATLEKKITSIRLRHEEINKVVATMHIAMDKLKTKTSKLQEIKAATDNEIVTLRKEISKQKTNALKYTTCKKVIDFSALKDFKIFKVHDDKKSVKVWFNNIKPGFRQWYTYSLDKQK